MSFICTLIFIVNAFKMTSECFFFTYFNRKAVEKCPLRKTWPSKDKSTFFAKMQKCILAFKHNPEYSTEVSQSLVWRIS